MFDSKNIIVFILVLLLSFGISFGVETNYNSSVSDAHQDGKIIYSGTITLSDTGSGDIYYTQAMLIAPVNYTTGMIRVICSEGGTEDVNVFYEYSFDNVSYFAATDTDADLDACGTTAVVDTVGKHENTTEIKYTSTVWMRVKFVLGQANDPMTISYALSFILPADYLDSDLSKVKNTPTS